jgi:hypothetical protein
VGKMIMKILLAILFLALLSPAISLAEPENYCLDQNSWAEWDELVANNPNDMEVQTLHALRIGLCFKVDRGGITIDQATEIFESAREAIIQKRKEDVKRNQDNKEL